MLRTPKAGARLAEMGDRQRRGKIGGHVTPIYHAPFCLDDGAPARALSRPREAARAACAGEERDRSKRGKGGWARPGVERCEWAGQVQWMEEDEAEKGNEADGFGERPGPLVRQGQAARRPVVVEEADVEEGRESQTVRRRGMHSRHPEERPYDRGVLTEPLGVSFASGEPAIDEAVEFRARQLARQEANEGRPVRQAVRAEGIVKTLLLDSGNVSVSKGMDAELGRRGRRELQPGWILSGKPRLRESEVRSTHNGQGVDPLVGCCRRMGGLAGRRRGCHGSGWLERRVFGWMGGLLGFVTVEGEVGRPRRNESDETRLCAAVLRPVRAGRSPGSTFPSHRRTPRGHIIGLRGWMEPWGRSLSRNGRYQRGRVDCAPAPLSHCASFHPSILVASKAGRGPALLT